MATGKGCGRGANYVRGWCQVLIPTSEPERFPSLLSSSIYNHPAATTLTSATTSKHLTCLDPSHPSHFCTVNRALDLRLVRVNHHLQEARCALFSSPKPLNLLLPQVMILRGREDGCLQLKQGRKMVGIGHGHVTDWNHLIKLQTAGRTYSTGSWLLWGRNVGPAQVFGVYCFDKAEGKMLALHGYLAVCGILSCLIFSHAATVCHFFDSWTRMNNLKHWHEAEAQDKETFCLRVWSLSMVLTLAFSQ